MKIGIYNEPPGGGIGGSETTVAVLAEALSTTHQVEILHHKQDMKLATLAEISNTDLSAAQMRYVEFEPYSFGSGHSPLQRYKNARAWQAALSEPYDLFINFTHGFPPFCYAPRGILVVLFPLHERTLSTAAPRDSSSRSQAAWQHLKTLYHEWKWHKRMSTYQIKTAISQFSQAWTKQRWGIDCEIVYPPAQTSFQRLAKRDAILSVGRFSVTGHSKKQLEMVAAFKELKSGAPGDWEYFCVGGVSAAPADEEYFQSVRRSARNCGAHALANVERGKLKELSEQAKIFWHAAGYQESDERPELCEHFGIATVEAMAAGCVPIVINKGGQPEIVQHGENGFVWNSLEELKDYTMLLSRDENLRAQMSDAARQRAAVFSREQFVKRFLELIEKAIQ